MQKLTAEEGARVLSVLRDAGEGVSLLARLPLSRRHADALAAKLQGGAGGAAGRAAALLGAEMQRTAELEQAHRDMLKEAAAAQRAAAAAAAAALLEATQSGTSPPAAAPADEADGPREDPALRSQYGLVMRLMRADLTAAHAAFPAPPAGAAAAAGGAAAAAAPESGLSALAATLRALEGVAARRLGSTRQQQADLEVEMANKMGRIDNAEREVALLRQELAKQRAARVRASGELDAQLAKLNDELATSQKLAGAELQGMQGAGAAKAASIADVHAKTEAALQAQLEKLQADLKAAADAHVDAEANLRKRRTRAKLEIEGLVRDYDAAQAAAHAEIEAVRASTAYEKKPLEDLRRYYGKVDDELARLEDERLKAERKYFVDVTVEAVRRRIAGNAVLRFYRPLKVLKREQEKWEAKERAKKGK